MLNALHEELFTPQPTADPLFRGAALNFLVARFALIPIYRSKGNS